VFVSTDHGFNLGHDPGQRDAQQAIVVARRTGDAREERLWEMLGRPRAYRYEFSPARSGAVPTLLPHAIRPSSRFEGEYEWPPRAVGAGWAHPAYASACASARRGLFLHPDATGRSRVTVDLPPMRPAGRTHGRPLVLVIGWISTGSTSVRARVGAVSVEATLRAEIACSETRLDVGATKLDALELATSGAPALFDYVDVVEDPDQPAGASEGRDP
jgi:hypothetical protein